MEDGNKVEEEPTIPEVLSALQIVRKFSQKNNLVEEIRSLREIEKKCFSEQVISKKQMSIIIFLICYNYSLSQIISINVPMLIRAKRL